jgi:phosphatidylserine/phosphatidylglycerophosphate/cardiolipin synthase-like enzyme
VGAVLVLAAPWVAGRAAGAGPPPRSVEVAPGPWPAGLFPLLAGAAHTVDATFYELADPRVEDTLETLAARGVRVRVLFDAEGPARARNQAVARALAARGVRVRFGPARVDLHQKTVTVDDQVSAVMTGNLVAADEDDTRDYAVVDRDPADVAAVETTFARDWAGRPVRPGPPGTDLVWSPGATGALVGLVAGARHRLLVEAEEMGDPAVTAALAAAARRGVAVQVVMTADPEWAPALADLRRAGVAVRLWPDRSGALYIHAKAVVADPGTPGARAFVGSQNFSTVSLTRNRELGLVTADPTVVGVVAETIEADARGPVP